MVARVTYPPRTSDIHRLRSGPIANRAVTLDHENEATKICCGELSEMCVPWLAPLLCPVRFPPLDAYP